MAYQQKTLPHDGDVLAFIHGVEPPRRVVEGLDLLDLFTQTTGPQAVLWGPSIVGFGRVDYVYPTGHSGSMLKVGFSPRKAALTFYGLTWYGSNDDLLDRLGPHRLGKGCLYVTRLSAVDRDVLRELILRGWLGNPLNASDEESAPS